MMTNNPNIQKVENGIFNLVLVNDSVICLFQTSIKVWDFIEYLGKQLILGEAVPAEIYVFTVSPSSLNEIVILENGKIVKAKIRDSRLGEKDTWKEYFIYTSIHDDDEMKRLSYLVKTLWPQIAEVLYG